MTPETEGQLKKNGSICFPGNENRLDKQDLNFFYV